MDDATRAMVCQSYDETIDEALSAGHDHSIAHKEGITAAAMFLAAVQGIEDALARSMVEALGLKPEH
jgi:hypothetical protein